MNRAVALEALGRANKVLKGLGVRYWIDCGTLLGAIREGDFMAHDLDVDLSCWDWERSEEISEAMAGEGFRLFRTFGTPERGYEQRYRWGNVKLDIFFFYDEGETCWQGSWLNEHLIVSRFPARIVQRTKTIDFQGLKVPVPTQAKSMLKARYGDWKTPVKRWDWARDPKCITRESHPDNVMADVTFVIKTFMRPHLAVRAVESIRNTYPDSRVVVVDDSDAPASLESQLEELRAILLRLPYDSGLSAGRNRGISLVETTYVCVMDDDMLVSEETHIPEMVGLLKDADVVCGTMRDHGQMTRWEGHYVFTEDGGLILKQLREDPQGPGVRSVQVDFGLNGMVSRTEFLRNHPWDEVLKLHEHTSFYIGLHHEGAKVLFSPDCVFEHRREGDLAYNKMRRRREFRLRFFDKHKLKYHIGVSGVRDEFSRRDAQLLTKLKRS